MPRRKASVPSYLRHPATNQAYVRIPDGGGGRRMVYLGVWDTPESKAEYRRVLAEHHATPAPAVAGSTTRHLTVVELLVPFMRWALTHYRKADGNPTSEIDEIKRSLAPLRRLYGHAAAAEFGPKALAAVRQEMVAAKWCRTLINRRIDRVKRAFRWGASEELVPVAVYTALRTVRGLQRGRTDVRESEAVTPVDPAHVAAALPHLSRHVRAMVELQQLTGMRPGEIRRLNFAEIDQTIDPWIYAPVQHKSAHRGKARVIPLGPRARAVLVAFVAGRDVAPSDMVFSPAVERADRYAALRAGRKSKVTPSQTNRKKPAPKRRPGVAYSATAYVGAVHRACDAAGIPRWHPNQLRHLFATRVRKAHGLEAAGAVLGHSKMCATEVYAERDMSLAVRVANEVG